MATFTLTAGADNFTGIAAVADIFAATPTTLNAADTLAGNIGDNDTLQLTAGGTYNLDALTASGLFSNIPNISSTAGSITLQVGAATMGTLTGTINLGSGTNTLQSVETTDPVDFSATTLIGVQTLSGAAGVFLNIKSTQLTSGGGSISKLQGSGAGAAFKATDGNWSTVGVTLTNVTNLGSAVANTTLTVDPTQIGAFGSGLVSNFGFTGSGNVLQFGDGTLDLSAIGGANNLQTLRTTSSTGATIKDNASARTIIGGGGNDVLTGGGGADKYTGGGGSDTFRDTATKINSTSITDFSGADTINVTDLALAGATATFTAGTLTIASSGVTKATISLTGTFTDPFTVTSDGAAGINIKYGAPVVAPTMPSGPTLGTSTRLMPDGTKAPLVGTYGDDIFVGSTAPGQIDTVLQNGTRAAQNTITTNFDGTLTITGPNGTDRMGYVERIRFDDGVVILNLPPAANTIASLYKVAFGRSPDEPGLVLQSNMATSGVSLQQIAGSFLGSVEAAALTLPAMSDLAYVTRLYQNAFGRLPDAAGLQVQLDALAHGTSRGTMLLNFASSAEQIALLGQTTKVGVFAAYPDATLG